MRSDRPGLARFAGAGALDTRPARPKPARLSGRAGWGGPEAASARVFRCQNKRRTSLLGAAGEGNGGLSASQRQMLMPLAACMQPCSAERSAAGAIRRVQAQERDAERGRWVVSVLATRGIDLFAANAIHGGAKRRHARGRYVRRLCCQVN